MPPSVAPVRPTTPDMLVDFLSGARVVETARADTAIPEWIAKCKKSPSKKKEKKTTTTEKSCLCYRRMGQKDVAAKKRERGHSRLLDLFANGAPSFGESAKEKTSSAHVGRRCHTREKNQQVVGCDSLGQSQKKMSKRFDAHCWAKPFAIAQILSFFPSSDQPRTVARHIFFCWRGHFFGPVCTHTTHARSPSS